MWVHWARHEAEAAVDILVRVPGRHPVGDLVLMLHRHRPLLWRLQLLLYVLEHTILLLQLIVIERAFSCSALGSLLLPSVLAHIQLREATEAGVCCGSAGIYNLVQPEEAAALGQLKARDLAGTGAELAVSANIGCSLQIRRHLQELPQPIPVLHPMQLLEQSYSG